MPYISDTIYALSTGLGKSAVAVVRVSGDGCVNILQHICGRKFLSDRTITYSAINDINGQIIDKGIVLFFRSPRSYTGEDMIEFQITGGRAVKSALLNTLSEFADTRPAEAGEFARRAFENGKMDLVQIEGLAAIVDAETMAQGRHSALMAFGSVSRKCDEARSELLEAASLIEGLLDFSDIEDPNGTTIAPVEEALRRAQVILQDLVRNGRVSEHLRSGFAVAVVGAPNVGKSTLLNYILQRQAAIVSDIPGTTRDYLEFFVELEGFPVVFLDTAGIRDAVDPVERIGIERSRERIRAVDLILWLSDKDHDGGDYLPEKVPTIKVRTKADLAGNWSNRSGEISISVHSNYGVASLISQVAARAATFFSDATEPGLGTERQRIAVRNALSAIDRALVDATSAEELVAEDIRAALTAIGRVTGRVDVEDVLDEVFARLCVGK